MTVIALSVLGGMLALVAMAVVLTIVAVLTAYALAPEQSKAFWTELKGVLDGWIGRVETLWTEVKAVVDHFVGPKRAEAQENPTEDTTASAAATNTPDTAAISRENTEKH